MGGINNQESAKHVPVTGHITCVVPARNILYCLGRSLLSGRGCAGNDAAALLITRSSASMRATHAQAAGVQEGGGGLDRWRTARTKEETWSFD